MTGQPLRDIIRDAFKVLPHVTGVDIEVETVHRVTVTIDSEPFMCEPRYEVYDIEAQLIRDYSYAIFDFRLENPREYDSSHRQVLD